MRGGLHTAVQGEEGEHGDGGADHHGVVGHPQGEVGDAHEEQGWDLGGGGVDWFPDLGPAWTGL